jgi:1-Cys peroxiredoxin 6
MVVPSLTDEQAEKRFAKGFEKATLPSGKGYIRLTPDPSQS